MYTWGSSPQALRLANQIKRRANAKQKLEENHQREMLSRRLEETLLPACSSSSAMVEPSTSYAAVVVGAIPKPRVETKESTENEAMTSNASESIGSKLTSGPTESVTPTASTTTATQQPTEPDPTEHMTPHLVDTSEVAGQILQVCFPTFFHFSIENNIF